MKAGFTLIASLLIIISLHALTFSHWKDISDGIEDKKLIDMYITEDNHILVANENYLYISQDGDGKWKKIFFINGKEKIAGITGTAKKIYIGTKNKIYSGDPDKNNFFEVFSVSKEDEIKAIELSASREYLYAGTKSGLWIISLKGDGERKLLAEIKNVTVLKSHPFQAGVVFAGTEDGLYKLSRKELKLLYTSISKTSSKVNSIAISKSNDDIIFIATDGGLIRMKLKNREFRDLKLNGKIFYVESFNTKPETIVALGEKDIFYSQNTLDKWNSINGVIPYGMSKKILYNSDSVYLLTDSGIFKSEDNSGAMPLKEIEQKFLSEPTIEEMERVVLRTHMVDRDIIHRWRKNSRLRALLPDIDVGVNAGMDRDFDRGVKDTIYTSSSSGRYYIGPDERKQSESYGRELSYGIKLSWKLGDAIFNSSELSVSNETEDILDFRYRILSDLRRVYFERRRLIAELYFLTQEDDYKKFELKNRIDELTAYLDMLSDGYFSRNIKNEKQD